MITISNFLHSIKITKRGKTRVYRSLIPTTGQNRLYAFLQANAEKFDVKPYSETNNGVTVIAPHSNIWTLK